MNNPNEQIREVRIPACIHHEGIYFVDAKLVGTCPKCGQPRGEVRKRFAYDFNRSLLVSGWDNPCGHTDFYSAVRTEAATNGLNPDYMRKD